MTKCNFLERSGPHFIVSCQPVENGPFDDDSSVLKFALAAQSGGADALRIEGAERVKLVKNNVNIPVIGIIKRDIVDCSIRITPYIDDVEALVDANADIIAFDGTMRDRPVSIKEILRVIKHSGCLSMADCSNYEDALSASNTGSDIIGTTLSGYTGNTIPIEPDYNLIEKLKNKVPYVMAEGRFNTVDTVRKAIKCGASGVTVGTAITRTEVITSWFRDAINQIS